MLLFMCSYLNILEDEKLNGTGSGLCLVVGFHIGIVDLSDSATIVLVVQ